MTQPAQQPEYIITEEQLSEIIGFQLFKKPELVRAIRSRPNTSRSIPEKCCIGLTFEQCQEVSAREKVTIRNATLDEMFPANTEINSNGDLNGGWEIDPKALFKLKKAIQSNPQYTEEPEAEVIEVVVLAIKASLRTNQEPYP